MLPYDRLTLIMLDEDDATGAEIAYAVGLDADRFGRGTRFAISDTIWEHSHRDREYLIRSDLAALAPHELSRAEQALSRPYPRAGHSPAARQGADDRGAHAEQHDSGHLQSPEPGRDHGLDPARRGRHRQRPPLYHPGDDERGARGGDPRPGDSRRRVGPAGDRARALERRAGAVRLRRLARPAGAAAHGRQLHAAPEPALPAASSTRDADEFIGYAVDGAQPHAARSSTTCSPTRASGRAAATLGPVDAGAVAASRRAPTCSAAIERGRRAGHARSRCRRVWATPRSSPSCSRT